jgi:hypothetical protein
VPDPIEKISQTIAPFVWPRIPQTGGVQLEAVASSGLPVAFQWVSGPATVSSSGYFTPVEAALGLVVLDLTQQGDDTWLSAPALRVSITLKKFQTISFPRPNVLRWEPTGPLDENDEPTYEQNLVPVEPWDLIWEEETPPVPPATESTFALVVVPLALSATSDSGLTAFVFSASLPEVASVDGDTLTYLQAFSGGMTLTATPPGDDEWWDSSASFTIGDDTPSGIPQEIRATIPLVISRGATVPITYGSYSLLPPFLATGLPVTVVSSDPSCIAVSADLHSLTALSVGAVFITFSQEGDATYGDAGLSFPVECGKLPQMITFPPLPTGLLPGATVEMGATSTSGLPVSYEVERPEVASVVGANLLLIKQMGTTKITATQTGNATFREAMPVAVTVAIGSSPQTITLGVMPRKTFGDPPFVPEGRASSGLPVTYTSGDTSVAVVTSGMISIVGAGAALIKATQAGDAFWKPAAEESAMLYVERGAPALRVLAPSHLLVGGAGEIIATASSGAPVSLRVAVTSTSFLLLDGTTVTGVAEGNGYIIAATEESDLYLAASVAARIIVGRIPQHITADLSFERTYSDREIQISAVSSSRLDVRFTNLTPEIADLVGDRVIFRSTGVSQIALAQEGDATYFPAPQKTLQIAIALGPQGVSFRPLPPLMVGETAPLVATAPGGPVIFYSSAPEVATVQGSSVTAHRVGSAVILATVDPLEGSFYLPSSESAQPLVVVAARSDALPVGHGVKDFEIVSSPAPSSIFQITKAQFLAYTAGGTWSIACEQRAIETADGGRWSSGSGEGIVTGAGSGVVHTVTGQIPCRAEWSAPWVAVVEYNAPVTLKAEFTALVTPSGDTVYYASFTGSFWEVVFGVYHAGQPPATPYPPTRSVFVDGSPLTSYGTWNPSWAGKSYIGNYKNTSSVTVVATFTPAGDPCCGRIEEARVKDAEPFDSEIPSPAFQGCSCDRIEEAGVKDVEPFDPKVPSPAFQGHSFDMLGSDRGGDETPYEAAQASVGWAGPSVTIPQAALGDGEGYVSTLESADTQAVSIGTEWNGVGELEEYVSAAPRQPSGHLLCSGGGYLLWNLVDDDSAATTGKFTL